MRRQTPLLRAVRAFAWTGLLACFASSGRASDCDSRFQLENEYYVLDEGSASDDVVAGDWNEDGRVDFATLSRDRRSLSVFLGEGGFRFGTPNRLETGDSPNAMVTDDMDGDGHLDLVVSGAFGTGVWRGDGRGGFLLQVLYPVTGDRVAVGDFDRDGVPDLAIGRTGEVALLFPNRPDRNGSVPGGPAIVLGDFDEDGDLDLATGNVQAIDVRLNDGSGRFGSLSTHGLAPCGGARSLDVLAGGDLGGDGHMDLLGASSDPRRLCDLSLRLLGRGDGTFVNPFAPEVEGVADAESIRNHSASPAGPLGDESTAAPTGRVFRLNGWILADLGHDRRDEVIEMSTYPGGEVMGRRSLDDPRAAAVADVDGDGNLDVIAAGRDGVAVHPGTGDNAIRSITRLDLGDLPVRAWALDFDRDGIEDLALGTGEGFLRIVLGTAAGGFGRLGYGYGNDRDEFADVNGDGVIDEITWDQELYLGRGDGSFLYPSIRYASTRFQSISAGDVDEDGKMDLVAMVWQDYREPPSPVHIFLGNGDGTFRDQPELDRSAGQVRLSDLDGDHHLDLIGVGATDGWVAFGRGDGTFDATTTLFSTSRLVIPEIGDIDGDGRPDLVARIWGPGGMVFLNRGRRFDPVSITVPFSAVGDLDGDGRTDLVAGHVYLGNGDATFRDAGPIAPYGSAFLQDRDRDGDLDLVIMRTEDREVGNYSVNVIWNRTTPNHAPVTTAAVGTLAVAWPPNHRLAPVGIKGITDADGDAVTLKITSVTQDEPLGSNGPDAIFTSGAPQVRIERDGAGNGRVYTIHFDAADGCGGVTEGAVSVCVPHDQGHGGACGDDGQRFNSLSRSWLASGEADPTDRPFSAQVHGERVALRYAADTATPVRLEVFDVAGRKLATVDEGPRVAGVHEASWNVAGVPRGIYFARLSLGAVTRTTTILLR